MPRIHVLAYAWILLASAHPDLTAQSWLPSSPYPSWASSPPASPITIALEPSQSAEANGARLYAAITALQPGQGLAVGPGVWSIPYRLDLNGIGSPQSPTWLFAANPAQKPVITRPNANQNVINVGSNAPARYWVLRDLEITGGSDLVKLYDCSHVWIDRCYVHDGGGVGIAAMTYAVSHLYITRNEIARPGPGTNGEGIYLGSYNPGATASWCVVAYNYVHSTRGAVFGQGDGIEVKQYSHHNWLLTNIVHDCKNPCILLYGTGGNGQNVVEGNLCFDSDEVVLQVQGEAIVRNNVAIGGGYGFSSHDHEGQSRDLQFVHNTVVNQGRAASMTRWSGRPGMVFANNVLYSLGAEAIWFGNGCDGVQMAGNVVLGPVVNGNGGYVLGAGLQDFVDVDLRTLHVNVKPVVGGAIDNRGSLAFAVPADMLDAARELPVDPGAVTNSPAFVGSTPNIRVATGGSLQLTFDAPTLAGVGYHVLGNFSGATPGQTLGDFTLPLVADSWFYATLQEPNGTGLLQHALGTLDGSGHAVAQLDLPPLSAALQGVIVRHVLVAVRGSSVAFVSNPVAVTLQ